nr:hypothetical protein [Tanacetum cinerariifolium]
LRFKIDNLSGQFGNQRTMNVAGAKEKECRKPKRVKDSAYHKEKMLLCKQAEQGVPLQAEQYDWLADTDEEVDEQELEAHYSYMAKIQEVPTAETCTDSEPVEQKANTTLAQELKECKAILVETIKSLRESISVWDSCLVALQTKQTEFEKYKAFNNHTIDYDKLERKLNETLGCVLSCAAFCLALRFAHLKTLCCVLLRTNSAKLTTALRFVYRFCCVLLQGSL